MTRWFPGLLIAALVLGGSLSPAEAKRGFGGVSTYREEVLRPVAPIDDTTALCHLVEHRSLFGIVGFWASSKAYVLGAPGCTGDRYGDLPAPVAMLKAQGIVPATVPDTPRLSPRDLAQGFGIWAALAALVLGLRVLRGLSRRKRKIRMEILALEDSPAFRMIDVMCHAAIADGKIDDAEIAYIRGVARELTGLDYSEAHIRETISRADRLSKPEHLMPFARGLTLDQRHLILQAALSVVAADGEMHKRESRFIGLLVAGFGLARDDLDQCMQILSSRRAGAAPA